MPRGVAIAALVLASACGRAGYDAVDLRPRPECDWREGPPELAPAVAIETSPSIEGDPFVDANGDLWLTSDRDGGSDLYVMRRLADGTFADPVAASDLDLGPDAIDSSLHVDQVRGIAVHAASVAGGEEGLYAAVRGDGGTFGAATRFEPGTGALRSHRDPFLGTDPVAGLLVLVWAPERAGIVGRRIHVVTRDLDAAFAPVFGPAQALDLGSTGDEEDPSLDVSLTTIVLTRVDAGVRSLWYATRETPDVGFGDATALPDLVPGEDRDAFLEPDGCTLWLVGGDGDVYRADVVR